MEPSVLLLISLGPLAMGSAVLVALRLVPRSRDSLEQDPLLLMLTITGWALIIVGVLCASVPVGLVPGVIALVVLAMVLRRRWRAKQYMLLSTLTVAAERNMPLIPVIEAFAWEHGGGLGARAQLLAERLKAGWPLPDAAEASHGLVPAEAKPAIRVGCETGALAEALRDQVDVGEAHDALWAQTAGKLLYLCCVLFFASGIIAYMLYYITPAFYEIFEDFSVDPPVITQTVTAVSRALVKGWGFVVVAQQLMFVLAAYACLRYIGVVGWELPGLGWMFRRLHTATILESLAVVAEKNRPFDEGIATLARSYPNGVISRRLSRVVDDVRAGHGWCASLAQRRLICQADQAVLEAAARVGNLPWAMREMGYSNRRRLIYRMQSWLQVGFVLTILTYGLVVCVFYLSYFLPMLELIQAVC